MTDNFMTMMAQSLASLAAVLALFAALVWLMRYFQGSSFQTQKGQAKVVQRLALDSKHSMVEVVNGQHHYLIGLSPNGITTIAHNIVQETTQQAPTTDT